MAQVPGSEKEVSGKWFVPALLIGFVVFAIVMTYGTWALGQAAAKDLPQSKRPQSSSAPQ